MEVKWPC